MIRAEGMDAIPRDRHRAPTYNLSNRPIDGSPQ